MVTTGIGVRTRRLLSMAFVVALAAAWSPAPRAAQAQLPAVTLFEMTGFIQEAKLDNPNDKFSGGTLTLNNHVVVIPRYTIFQMPATSLTWAELFTQAPEPWGPTQSGLALKDTPKPDYTFEVSVQGNRVIDGDTDRYIAGLVFISNQSLQSHQGFIKAIDYTTGELTVGTTRVRLNDPIGRFGRAWTHDERFTIDEDNPTVKSETGYPMCIPRTDPAVTDDALCPAGNRIDGKTIFTMSTQPAPTASERANPALRDIDFAGRRAPKLLDPWRAAPFKVGDYVTVRGPIVKDGESQFVSAYAVDANVGIFTVPGTQPAYVSIDLVLTGTGPVNDPTLVQEGARRTRAEGFSTDITIPVVISALDVDACTGENVPRFWAVEAIDPGAPTGAVAGRWRFEPAALGIDLKGMPYFPPPREVQAVNALGTAETLNGLMAGEYTSPIGEFILPENRDVGTPIVRGNFEAMDFLTQGSGPREGGFTGQLDPWPGDAASKPVRNGCAVVGADLSVRGGTANVQLDGSPSIAANAPVGAVSYRWSQVLGPSVAIANASSANASFTAPTVTANTALTFQLTVTPANGAAPVASRFVTVTVTPPPDTIAPNVTALNVTQGTSTTLFKSTSTNPRTTTITTTATDNVAVTSVSVTYSYTDSRGAKQTVPVTVTKSTTVANQWSGSFAMPTVGGSYTFTATAFDAMGNNKSMTTTKTVN